MCITSPIVSSVCVVQPAQQQKWLVSRLTDALADESS